MALPTTISGIDVAVPVAGPFKSSAGNIYFIGKDSATTNTLRAFKATDPTTSFSNVGTDFTVTNVTVGAQINAISAWQDGDTLHVATSQHDTTTTTNNKYTYHTFSMSSDSWTLTNEAIIASAVAVTATSGANRGVSICKRSQSGEIIVVYQGAVVLSMSTNYSRLLYTRRTGVGTWSAGVVSDNSASIGGADYISPRICPDPLNDRVVLSYLVPASIQVNFRVLSAANALSAQIVGTSSVAASANLRHSITAWNDAGTARFVLANQSNTAGSLSVARWASADAPTRSLAASASTSTSPVGVYNDEGNTGSSDVWFLYRNSSDSDLYVKQSTDDGATFGSATNAMTAATTVTAELSVDADRTGTFIRGSNMVIPYIVNDNGTLKYNEYNVRAVVTDILASATQSLAVAQSAAAAVAVAATAAQSLTVQQSAALSVVADRTATATQSLEIAQSAAAKIEIAASATQSLATQQIAAALAPVAAQAAQSLAVAQSVLVEVVVVASATQPLAAAQVSEAVIEIRTTPTQSLAVEQSAQVAVAVAGQAAQPLAVSQTVAVEVTASAEISASAAQSLAVAQSVAAAVSVGATATQSLAAQQIATGAVAVAVSAAQSLAVEQSSAVAGTVAASAAQSLAIAQVVAAVVTTAISAAQSLVVEQSATAAVVVSVVGSVLNAQINTETIGANGGWALNQASVTQGQADPFGGSTATRLKDDTTADSLHQVVGAGSRPASVSLDYGFSVWAKRAVGTRNIFVQIFTGPHTTGAEIDLSDGTVTGHSWFAEFTNNTVKVEKFANGWFRIFVTGTYGAAITNIYGIVGLTNPASPGHYDGDGSSGVDLWGWNFAETSSLVGFNPTTSEPAHGHHLTLSQSASLQADFGAILATAAQSLSAEQTATAVVPVVATAAQALVAEQIATTAVDVVASADQSLLLGQSASIGTLVLVYVRPDSDVLAGDWTTHLGGTTNLYAMVDEAVADDDDYIRSPDLASGDPASPAELGLGNPAPPAVDTGHTVRYRYRKQSEGGGVPTNLTVKLMEGATEIASWPHTNVGDSWTTAEQPLTEEQAAAITDYSDLRVRLIAEAP
jgi:hypothetical protein